MKGRLFNLKWGLKGLISNAKLESKIRVFEALKLFELSQRSKERRSPTSPCIEH